MHRLLYPTSLCVLLLLLVGCTSSASIGSHSPNDTTATATAAAGASTENPGAAPLVGRGLSAAADPEVGRALFHGEEESDAEGFMACKTCHYADPEKDVLVGPNLAGIANHAGSRVAGQSAEEYLQISTIDHNAYIVEGFQENIVLNVVGKDFGEILQPDDIDHLVAYMMTLEEGVVAKDEQHSPTPTPTAEVAVELSVDGQGYVVHDDGYAFQPPIGWETLAVGAGAIAFTRPADADTQAGPVIVMRSGTPESLNLPNERVTPVTSTAQLFDTLFERFEEETFRVTLTDTLDIEIGGMPGRVASVIGNGLGEIEGEVAGRLALAFTPTDNVFVILGLASPADEWRIEAEFEAIVASLTFDDIASVSPYLHTTSAAYSAPRPVHTAHAWHTSDNPHEGALAHLLQDEDEEELRSKGPRFGCVNCHVTHEVEMGHESNPSCNTCHNGTPYQRHCVDCHSIHDVDITHKPNNPGCDTCHAQGIPGDGVSMQETLVIFMAYLFHDI